MASSVDSKKVTGLRLVRAIPSARLRAAALMSLVNPSANLDDLAELVSATNARLAEDFRDLDIDPRELAPPGMAGASIINAAFCHPRPGGNRFNDGRRGAWYAADDVETCLAEVAFHIARELDNIGRMVTQVEYAALHATINGDFATIVPPATELDADPRVGYPAGQALATNLRRSGLDGLFYPSVRRPSHECTVVFNPRSISEVVEGAVWRLTWDGSPIPTVSQLTP